MPKFRKNPIVIEAVQWKDKVMSDDPEWLILAFHKEKIVRCGDVITIKTLEGDMTASDGDWIIQGIKGELYPCKNEIFQAAYHQAE